MHGIIFLLEKDDGKRVALNFGALIGCVSGIEYRSVLVRVEMLGEEGFRLPPRSRLALSPRAMDRDVVEDDDEGYPPQDRVFRTTRQQAYS